MALRGDDLSTGHWKKQRLRVLARDGYTCTYCGEVATEVDHVIPRKVGGGHGRTGGKVPAPGRRVG